MCYVFGITADVKTVKHSQKSPQSSRKPVKVRKNIGQRSCCVSLLWISLWLTPCAFACCRRKQRRLSLQCGGSKPPPYGLVRFSVVGRRLRAVEGASPYGWCVFPSLVADRGPPRTPVSTSLLQRRRWRATARRMRRATLCVVRLLVVDHGLSRAPAPTGLRKSFWQFAQQIDGV